MLQITLNILVGAFAWPPCLRTTDPTVAAGSAKSTGANKRKFLLTYVNLTFDGFGTGNATGTLKVRQTAKLDQTGNTYRGSGGYTYYDLDGNVVLTGPSTITAARIQAEAPAAP